MTEALAWRRWHDGRDQRSRDFLLARYAPLVPLTLRRVKIPARVEREDVVSVAHAALYIALTTFDREKSAFQSWAITTIAGAVRESCREADPVSRHYRDHKARIAAACDVLGGDPADEALAEATGLTVPQVQAARRMPDILRSTDESVAAADGVTVGDAASGPMAGTVSDVFDDPAALALRSDSAERLGMAIDRLKPRTACMMREYYYDGNPKRVVAQMHGVSESRVQQLIDEGLERLRATLTESDWIEAKSERTTGMAGWTQEAKGYLMDSQAGTLHALTVLHARGGGRENRDALILEYLMRTAPMIGVLFQQFP